MSVRGNGNYTGFRNILLRGDQQGTSSATGGQIRFADPSSSGVESTLSVGTAVDAARAWAFPNRSGRFSTSGSFAVDFPAIAATTFSFATIVTVSGITAQDVVTVTPNAAMSANSTARIFSAAVPGAGSITLYFTNIGSAANGLYTQVFGYTATRD